MLIGCTQSLETKPDDSSTEQTREHGMRPLVELFSWWTAPGEAEAFQRLVDAHKSSYPDARLFNAAAASGALAREILKQRLIDNELPDLFQDNASDLATYVRQNPGKIMPLDGLYDELKLRSVVFPEVLADLTIEGHFYSIPVNLHRENTLIYNKKLFAQYGLAVPRTLDELLVVCDVFKRHGVTAIATTHQGWVLRILFNSILIAKMGSHHYNDYFMGRASREDPLLRESIRILDELLTNYSNSDAGEDGFGWMNAAQAVLSGDAAMYFHGDWAKGYLVQLGASPDTDFGAVAAPGTQDAFLYNVDVFAMPRHAPNEVGATAFLTTIASRAAQAAFNRIKGSSSVRTDGLIEDFDQIGRDTMRDLMNAQVRMLVRNGDGCDDALGVFAKYRDEDTLYETYVNNPPMIE